MALYKSGYYYYYYYYCKVTETDFNLKIMKKCELLWSVHWMDRRSTGHCVKASQTSHRSDHIHARNIDRPELQRSTCHYLLHCQKPTESNSWVGIQKTKTIWRLQWLSSQVVSMLDSGAEEPGFNSQLRRCRVKVLGKLFTPIVPMFTKEQNW